MNFDILYTSFPQQVSVDQAGEEKSEIVFSNGASLTPFGVESNQLAINSTPGRHVTCRHESTNAHRSTNPARHPEYTDCNQRLGSYARWPLRKPNAVSLCDAGFFFSNQYDLVRCFQCGIGLKDFSEGDDPLMEHVRHSPNCQFLVGYLGTERLSAIKLNMINTLHAIVLLNCIIRGPRIITRKQIKCQAQQSTRLSEHQEELFEHTNSQCRHPEYYTMQARLSSFARWPGHIIQTPLQLAEAGLYYTGFEDQVRCFMCDGGLRQWDPEDVPWTEHCRWFPDCQFAREVKGREFIALVQASADNTNGENRDSTNGQQVSGSQDLINTMEQMTLKDPTLRAAMQEHKDTCLEMGFPLTDINAAVEELIKMGNVNPAIEELLDTIDVLKERQLKQNTLEMKHHETPLEENQRLKSLIICMACAKSNVNAIFLPCTHHRLCMECAEPMTKCPVCETFIRQKIRTYLAWIKPERNVEFSAKNHILSDIWLLFICHQLHIAF